MSAQAQVRLLRALEERGCAVRIVAIERIREARAAIEDQHAQGALDAGLFDERFTERLAEPLPVSFAARSVIVVAVPSAVARVRFRTPEPRMLLLPPTYKEYPTLPPRVAAWVAEALRPEGHRVAPAMRVPLKSLAVRSGLGEYGRNNLCYVSGMGSYAHLVGLYSDLEPHGEQWRDPKMLDRCLKCRACIRACPAEAIELGRFLVRAERCITYHTEKPEGVALPDWGAKRPACVFGCMECQRRCPENRAVTLPAEESEEFDEEETARLLASAPLETLPGPMLEKLRRLDWLEVYGQLSRNLTPLLAG